mmetsp:Transcript_99103/g.196435  ORF Transcript_99103/g.196435 Transcript_99103/m.196435 type:complete len:183 (+) Transcript_99103:57-605(+)
MKLRAFASLFAYLLYDRCLACENNEPKMRSCYVSGKVDGVNVGGVCGFSGNWAGIGQDMLPNDEPSPAGVEIKDDEDCDGSALDSCQAKCDFAKLTAFCYKAQNCVESHIGTHIRRVTGRSYCEQYRTLAHFMEGCKCDANCSDAGHRSQPATWLLLLACLLPLQAVSPTVHSSNNVRRKQV